MYENRGTYDGDSGLDLFDTVETVVPPHSTGFVIDLILILQHYLINMISSSHVITMFILNHLWVQRHHFRLANSVGIIDAGYRGNIMLIVDNHLIEEYVDLCWNKIVSDLWSNT